METYTLINWISGFLSDTCIEIRIDGFLAGPHSIDAGVLQGSVISPVLFIFFINDLLTSTVTSIYSFADDTYLSSSFSFDSPHISTINTPLQRNISASLLTDDLAKIEKCGKDNLVKSSQTKTIQVVISCKHNPDFPFVSMNGAALNSSTCFSQTRHSCIIQP